MAKRKRSPSPSSSEDSDDEPTNMYLPETAVLRKISDDMTNPDTWPVFVLADATVYRRDGNVENALMATTKGPFTLQGRLVIDSKGQRDFLRKPYRKANNVMIKVLNSPMYAIGTAEEDGRPVFWGSGLCGWFEIEPSLKYTPMYTHIVRGLALFYHIVTVYDEFEEERQKSKRLMKPPSVDDVLMEYAIERLDGSTKEDVEEHARMWSQWMLQHIEAGKEQVKFDWKTNEFYKRLGKWAKTATAIEMSASRLGSTTMLPARPKQQLSRSSPARSTSAATHTTEANTRKGTRASSRLKESLGGSAKPEGSDTSSVKQGTKRSQERSKPETVAVPQEVQPAADWYELGLASMMAALEDIWSSTSPDKLTVSYIANKLYFDYKAKSYHGRHEPLHYYAEALVKRLDQTRWGGLDFYENWLKAKAKEPWSSEDWEPQKGPIVMEKRKVVHRMSKKDRVPTDVRTLESLRIVDKDGKAGTNRPMIGRTSALRLSTGGKKRTAPDTDTDAETNGGGGDGGGGGVHVHPRKAAKTSHYFSEGEEDDEEEDGEEMQAGIVIRAEPLPSTVPQGHNGTWVCEEDDCDHIVRRDHMDDSLQERIQLHFYDHEDKISLALKESQQGLMPINHLLEKIRRANEKAFIKSDEETKFDTSQKIELPEGMSLPSPIRGKLSL